ncbi:phage tail tape measure protein [uncultured Cohaesibacter sp.]|uniref:phage tail tape measure protein n=1 Tax=uncultured Cohaesibacter sp. TaxID=1002546 RepID=UPI0029C7AC12|nr:phage tail tape measure protein [uncultured Cohaesibacter sp.]
MTDEVVETAIVKVEADLRSFTKDISSAQKEADMLGDKVANAMQKALMGSADLESIFKNLALDMSQSFYTAGVAPLKELVSGSVSNIASGLFATLGLGNAGSSSLFGSLLPFANGGVVNGTTLFPMQSGLGMMGEAGAEAIMPLQRGADGSLGVAMHGAGSRPVSVVMNVSTPDVASFAKSENQIATKLARAVGRGRRGL